MSGLAKTSGNLGLYALGNISGSLDLQTDLFAGGQSLQLTGTIGGASGFAAAYGVTLVYNLASGTPFEVNGAYQSSWSSFESSTVLSSFQEILSKGGTSSFLPPLLSGQAELDAAERELVLAGTASVDQIVPGLLELITPEAPEDTGTPDSNRSFPILGYPELWE